MSSDYVARNLINQLLCRRIPVKVNVEFELPFIEQEEGTEVAKRILLLAAFVEKIVNAEVKSE